MHQTEPHIWTPTIHPFTQSGELDESGFRVLVRRLVDAGVHLNLPNQGQGESWSMTVDEARRVMEIAVDEAAGRVRVIGMWRQSHSAQEHVAFIESCQEIGLDGVLIYGVDPGHHIRPTEPEMEAYLTEVLTAGRIPMQIEVLGAAGYQYPVALLERMAARFEMLTSIMIATPDQRYLRAVQDALGDRLEIHSASYPHLFALLESGVTGISFSIANLIPRLCVNVLEHYKAGRYQEMQQAFVQVQTVKDRIEAFNGTRDVGRSEGVKAALNVLGLPGGYPRRPRLPVPAHRIPDLEQTIDDLQLRELQDAILP